MMFFISLFRLFEQIQWSKKNSNLSAKGSDGECQEVFLL